MAVRRDEASLPDEAIFAPARLTRARPPVVAIAMAVVVGGLALVGVLGGSREPASGEAAWSAANVARPGPTTVIDSTSAREAPWRSRPGGGGEPFATPLLALDARVSGRQLFISGDVFTRLAVVVVVTVGDSDGTYVEVRSIELPGGSTAFRLGANDRFDIAFAVDDWPASAGWAMATAYDRAGNALESVRQTLVVGDGHERLPAGAAR